MISIIIPVYNQADKIVKTLKSLESQTYLDFEVIIVDDGSRDNLSAVVGNFLKKSSLGNSFLFLKQKNMGAPAARNLGLSRAQGEFLFFLDADVVLTPQALEVYLNTLVNNPGASYCYSSFYFGSKLFRPGEFSKERLLAGPFISTMSLIKKSDFPANSWDVSLKRFQDWDLYLTMLRHGHQGVFVDQVLWKAFPGGTMSSWLPKSFYRYFKFLPVVKKYHQALEVVKKKHQL